MSTMPSKGAEAVKSMKGLFSLSAFTGAGTKTKVAVAFTAIAVATAAAYKASSKVEEAVDGIFTMVKGEIS